MVGVVALHLLAQSLKQLSKGWALRRGEKGKFSAALRKLVRPLWTAAGARVRVDTGPGSLAPSSASQPPAPLALFSSRRVFKEGQSRKSGVRGAG